MVAFNVNGKRVSVDADADTPLLWAIRDHLNLTGTKFGCGAGYCGACIVHINGKAVRSCLTTLSEVSGASVMTIEGLSPDSSHPLQKAWIAEQVLQRLTVRCTFLELPLLSSWLSPLICRT